jgi:hypothetical protein
MLYDFEVRTSVVGKLVITTLRARSGISFGWAHASTHLHVDASYRLKVLISRAIKGLGL